MPRRRCVAVAEDLRRSQAAWLHTVGPASYPMAREKSNVLNSLARHLSAGLGDTAAETARDVWI